MAAAHQCGIGAAAGHLRAVAVGATGTLKAGKPPPRAGSPRGADNPAMSAAHLPHPVLSGLLGLFLAATAASAASTRVPAIDAARAPIAQQDAKAQQLREQLRRIRLPAGRMRAAGAAVDLPALATQS